MKKLINKAVNNIMENLATRVAKLVPMDSLTREVVTTMEYDALADHVDLNILADQFTTDEIAMATHITPEDVAEALDFAPSDVAEFIKVRASDLAPYLTIDSAELAEHIEFPVEAEQSIADKISVDYEKVAEHVNLSFLADEISVASVCDYIDIDPRDVAEYLDISARDMMDAAFDSYRITTEDILNECREAVTIEAIEAMKDRVMDLASNKIAEGIRRAWSNKDMSDELVGFMRGLMVAALTPPAEPTEEELNAAIDEGLDAAIEEAAEAFVPAE